MHLPQCFHDPDLMESLFAERFRRPPVWFELVEKAAIEPIAWELSRRLRMHPPTIDLARVCDAAWDRIKWPAADAGAFAGWREPLGQAVPRLGVPQTGTVLLYCGGEQGARLRMRDLVEFDSILWWDNSWAIDENADWMLHGRHDWPASWLRLSSVGRA